MINASVQVVAKAAEVSEPTVIRFCRRIGLEGFKQLKTGLIAALQRSESYLHHDVVSSDSASSAASKILESSIETLVDLRQQISRMPFAAAAGKMKTARQITFVGLGASGHVASDACHKFFRLGIPCTTALDTPGVLQQASVCQPRDVFVAISHTGRWPEMIRGMRLARARGAETIAVTDADSPLAEVVGLIFPSHADEDTSVYTPMSSRLAQLTLLDALQVSVALAVGPKAENNLRSTKAALVQERYETGANS